MFGLSFGEILVVAVIGMIVLGPKRLPEMMRTAGQWVSKLRRISGDLRAQSGIDDLIRQEGLESEIQELKSLSRINVIDTLMTPAAASGAARVVSPSASASQPARLEAKAVPSRAQPLRAREYPVQGCDAYGALADDILPKPVAAVAVAPAVDEAASDGESAPGEADASAPSAEATKASV